MADNRVTIEITGDATGAKKAFSEATGGLKSINDQAKMTEAGLAKIGSAAGIAATAIAGAFAFGTKEFLKFDNAIKQSGVVSGSLGTEEFKALREEVKRLGIETTKAPAEIAQTSVALSRAGFAAEETSAALEGIVRASEATGSSLEVVGDITAKLVRSFGLTADESGRIADVLVATANNTNTSVEGLGESFKYISSVAAASNQSLEEIAVAIGLLGDSGIQGSQAGTNLATALERLKIASAASGSELGDLARGSAAASEALRVIGAEVRDAEGQLKPISEILPILRQGFEKLSQQDKDIVSKVLFGAEGGRAIQTLLNTSQERIDSVSESIRNSGGAAKKAGEEMLQGLGGALQLIEGSFSSALAEVGEFSAAGLEPLVRAANQVLVTFLSLPAPIQNVLIAITGLAGILSASVAVLAAYNIAANSTVIVELKLAAAQVKRTAAAWASNAATIASTATMKGATAASLGYLKAIAPLLIKLAALVAVFIAAEKAIRAFGDQSNISKSGTRLRDELSKIELQAKGATKAIEETNQEFSKLESRPKRTSPFDFFNIQGKKRAEDAKVAAREFGISLGDLYDQLNLLGDSSEDAAKKQDLLSKAQDDLNDKLEQANNIREDIGEEAYQEVIESLQVAQAELDSFAKQQTKATASTETAATATQTQTESIDDQNAALEEQIANLEKLRDEEKQITDQRKEDEEVALGRKREDEKAARDEKNQDLLHSRQEKFDRDQEAKQTAFALEQEKLKDQREAERLQRKRAIEDADRQDAAAFESELKAAQDEFAAKDDALKLSFQKRLQDEQALFTESQQLKAEQFAEGQQSKAQLFNDQLEAEKDAAAQVRRDAEKALADEISARMEAQAQGFTEAGRQISEAGKLAAVESEEERQKLITQFEDRRRQEAEVAALDLAGKVFNPEELIAQAKEIAQIQAIATEEDAKKLQDTLALIEAEQREQQAAADAAAKLELQESLQAQQEAFESKLEERRKAFTEQQQAAVEQFQKAQEELRDQKEAERQAMAIAFESERTEARRLFETALDAAKTERELALIALRRQREDEDRREAEQFQSFLDARQKAFDEQQESAAEQFQEQQNAIQKEFADSERDLQRAFEDAQREKERAFNAAERAKDEALAIKVAALNKQLAANTKKAEAIAAPQDVDGLFKGGPVVKGRTYLVGERNPEPLVFNSGKVAMVGTNGPELIRPMASGYVYPNLAALNSAGVLRELQGLRGDVGRSPRSIGAANYTIVGAQDPVRATIKLQQERIRQQSRLSRL